MRRRSVSSKKGPNTLLLLHFDGNYNDSSQYNLTPTVYSEENISFPAGKFNQGLSVSDYRSCVNYEKYSCTWLSNLLNSGNFTIEAWAKVVNGDWAMIVVDQDIYGNNFRFCICTHSAVRKIFFGHLEIPVSGLYWNTWYHIAASSSNKTLRFFVNGQLQNTFTNQTFSLPNSGDIVSFCGGINMDDSAAHWAIFDELRISDGARYTTNFTPPTIPFTP